MILKQLFRNVPLEQFKPSSQTALGKYLHAINTMIKSIEGAPYECLFDAFASQPDVFSAVTRGLFTLGEPFMEKTLQLDFQGAWMLDGGRLIDMTGLTMGAYSDDYLSKLASNTLRMGAHHPLLVMGFKDPALSLQATSKVLNSLFHPQGDSYDAVSMRGGQVNRLSLSGFEHEPDAGGNLFEVSELYLSYFHPKGESGELPERAQLVEEIYNLHLDSVDTVDQALQRTLNLLVYNPGLRLMLKGVDPLELYASASLMLEAISTHIDGRIRMDREEENDLPKFALANLFSPFVGLHESLGISDDKLHGKFEGSGSPRSVLQSTFQGPLGSFSGTDSEDGIEVLAEGWENSGYEIELDKAFYTTLSEHEYFSSLVAYKGSSPMIDRLFCFVAKNWPKNEDIIRFLRDNLASIDFNRLSPAAKVGQMAVLIGLYKKTSVNIYRDNPMLNPSHTLGVHPELKKDVLDYMTRNDLLDVKMLHYVGFDSEVLNELGNKAGDRLKEDFLAQDLGL